MSEEQTKVEIHISISGRNADEVERATAAFTRGLIAPVSHELQTLLPAATPSYYPVNEVRQLQPAPTPAALPPAGESAQIEDQLEDQAAASADTAATAAYIPKTPQSMQPEPEETWLSYWRPWHSVVIIVWICMVISGLSLWHYGVIQRWAGHLRPADSEIEGAPPIGPPVAPPTDPASSLPTDPASSLPPIPTDPDLALPPPAGQVGVRDAQPRTGSAADKAGTNAPPAHKSSMDE